MICEALSAVEGHAAVKLDAPEIPCPTPGDSPTENSTPGWPAPGACWLPTQKSNAPGWLTDEANRRWRRSRYPRGG